MPYQGLTKQANEMYFISVGYWFCHVVIITRKGIGLGGFYTEKEGEKSPGQASVSDVHGVRHPCRSDWCEGK